MINEMLSAPTPEQIEELNELEETAFSYAGYQVVRGEFFAHLGEPSITFSGNKVSVNTACIRKLPKYDFIQILVNPEEKKLAVKPCPEESKDSFRWTTSTAKKKPKQITCKIFSAKVFTLMDWNPGYRYKLLGKLIRSGGEYLFVFDLNEPEIFTHVKLENGKIKTSRTAVYPEEWKNQFGVPVEEHENTVQVSLFNQLTVFGIQKKPNGTGAEKEVAVNEY